MSELKPCPFCGSPAAEPFKTIRGNKLYTECSECGAGMMTVAAWNRRAPSPSEERLVEERDRLREAAKSASQALMAVVMTTETAAHRADKGEGE